MKALTALPLIAFALSAPASAAVIARGEVYSVIELAFTGPAQTPSDAPARDVDFQVRFRHESGSPACTIRGFWDGDGKGGASGDVFKVRFCPVRPGRWRLEAVSSNRKELDGEKEGEEVVAVPSSRKGFWIPDPKSPGRRWYQRSDGSHAYICGDTMYSFLSERNDHGPTGSDIARDVRNASGYFNKLRFSIHPDRYPHPSDKPFLDDAGRPTDDGDYSHRPNPRWFHNRVDLAVRTAFERDMIADMILNGPDTYEARSALRAGKNHGDPTPFLKYIAARYGGFPNVWLCLSNEWDIREVKYTAQEIAERGRILRRFLPYPTPLSVHGVRDWKEGLNANPPWNDHIILQTKVKTLPEAADAIRKNYRIGGADRPVINDELAYQGGGDGFSESDVVEAFLGAFLGGGYATTGYKPENKKGHYFWGNFKASEHTAASPLKGFRERIDREIPFWTMEPMEVDGSLFQNVPSSARAMRSVSGDAFVLGVNRAAKGMAARLPTGEWTAKRYDLLNDRETTLASHASGALAFNAPDSRATLFIFQKSAAREGSR